VAKEKKETKKKERNFCSKTEYLRPLCGRRYNNVIQTAQYKIPTLLW